MSRIVKSLLLPLALLAAPALAQAPNPVLAKLESLAASGNAEANYHLGMVHRLGLNGAPKDDAKALPYFRKAAEAGDPLAAYQLGKLLESEPDESLRWKNAAAEAGFAPAQHEVARTLYEAGEVDKALEWLTQAARQGDKESLRALASLYSGEGKAPRDAARSWAYLTILEGGPGKATGRVSAWLAQTSAAFTPEEKARADDILLTWKVQPSPVTLRAAEGSKRLQQLVGAPARPKAGPPSEEGR